MVKTLGYMVTWTTYGTWLQGDEQGYVKKGKVLGANRSLRKVNVTNQAEKTVKLTRQEQEIVRKAVENEAARLRAYPNNPLYCGRLQSPMPALLAKNVLNVEKTTSPSIFGLPPWPRTFRSAS